MDYNTFFGKFIEKITPQEIIILEVASPDQTNQLTGVLIRFREELILMVADVEAMFLQVMVEPQDYDALRFLWWLNEDLSGEMDMYRMTRHLDRATSLPSVRISVCAKQPNYIKMSSIQQQQRQ